MLSECINQEQVLSSGISSTLTETLFVVGTTEQVKCMNFDTIFLVLYYEEKPLIFWSRIWTNEGFCWPSSHSWYHAWKRCYGTRSFKQTREILLFKRFEISNLSSIDHGILQTSITDSFSNEKKTNNALEILEFAQN